MFNLTFVDMNLPAMASLASQVGMSAASTGMSWNGPLKSSFETLGSMINNKFNFGKKGTEYYNKQVARNLDYADKLAQLDSDYQLQNIRNAPQALREGLKQAGLNPALAGGNLMSTSAPSSAGGSAEVAPQLQAGKGSPLVNLAGNYALQQNADSMRQQTESNVELQKSQANLNNATADKVKSETSGQEIENSRKNAVDEWLLKQGTSYGEIFARNNIADTENNEKALSIAIERLREIENKVSFENWVRDMQLSNGKVMDSIIRMPEMTFNELKSRMILNSATTLLRRAEILTQKSFQSELNTRSLVNLTQYDKNQQDIEQSKVFVQKMKQEISSIEQRRNFDRFYFDTDTRKLLVDSIGMKAYQDRNFRTATFDYYNHFVSGLLDDANTMSEIYRNVQVGSSMSKNADSYEKSVDNQQQQYNDKIDRENNSLPVVVGRGPHGGLLFEFNGHSYEFRGDNKPLDLVK